MRFNLDVLTDVLSLDKFLVVEEDSGFLPLGILAEDVDGFLLRKVPEPAGQCKRVNYSMDLSLRHVSARSERRREFSPVSRVLRRVSNVRLRMRRT